VFDSLKRADGLRDDKEVSAISAIVSETLVRSMRYFDSLCKDLKIAVQRNDELQFKLFLFVINVLSFLSTTAYDFWFPPAWKTQIQDMSENGVTCTT